MSLSSSIGLRTSIIDNADGSILNLQQQQQQQQKHLSSSSDDNSIVN